MTRAGAGAPSAGRPSGWRTTGLGRVVRIAALVVPLSYGCLIAVATVPVAFGWNASVVMSGSMRPAFNPGDVVLSMPARVAELRPGQVVLVADPVRPGHLLMHRYVSQGPNGSLITRGDANGSADSTPVPLANVRGLPRMRVPGVGLPVLWLRTHDLAPLISLVVLLTLAMWSIVGGPSSRRGPRTAPTRTRGYSGRRRASGQRSPA